MPDTPEKPDTRLILHLKETGENTELPKQEVRAAISKGQIRRSQLIWSPIHNTWKQVRELPHLWPSQKLAPPPARRVGTSPLPMVRVVEESQTQTGSVPRIAKATGSIPRVAAGTSEGTPAVKVSTKAAKATADHLVVEEKEESHPLKWLCIGLGVVIILAVTLNYLLVNQPLASGDPTLDQVNTENGPLPGPFAGQSIACPVLIPKKSTT